MRSFRHNAPVALPAAAIVAIWLPTAALAIWWPTDPARRARGADLVVAGAMVDVERDLVEFQGEPYAKRVGTIRVEKVLLKEQGVDVPKHVRVVWGNHLRLAGPAIHVWEGRRGPGIWILDRLRPGGPFLVLGSESDFFVPEARSEWLLRNLSEVQPLGLAITRKGGSLSLRIRYLNFGEEPRRATLWAVKDGSLLAPAPFELKIVGSRDPSGEGERAVLARTAPLPPEEAETVEVEPHSYVEKIIDVSEWIPDDAPGGPALAGYLSVEGKRDLGVAVGLTLEDWLRLDQGLDCGKSYVLDDWDDTVWWFPSAAKLFWLTVILGPIAAALGFAARRRGARFPSAACVGTALGLVWAWLLVTYAPDAILSAILAGQGRAGTGYSGVVLLGLLLLAPPSVVGAGMAKWRWGGVRLKEGAGLFGVWLGLPLVVALVHFLVLGPFAIL